MAVHWGSVTSNTSQYGAYINVYEVANTMNIANNTTNVRVDFHITRSNWGWQTGNSYSGNVVIDGTTYSFSYSPNWAYASSGDVIIATFTKTVPHNDDGSKWCNASATWWTSGTYSCGTASASGGVTLSTIPRASGIACNSPNIGDAMTITIDKKATAFTNTVTYNIGGLTGTIATKTSAVTINYPTEDLADEIYALIPSATQISGTVYCTTYNGNTQIGSATSANFKLYANETDVKPDISGTIVDTNPTTIALTGNSSTIVKYASAPKVTITATPKQSATIKSYNINANDGQVVNVQEYTFSNGIASSEISISTTDSRNYSASGTLKPTVIDYIPVIINTYTAERTEELSSEILLTAGGVWFNGNFSDNVANTLTCQFWYREAGINAEWVDGGTIVPTIEGNTFYFNELSLGDIYDYQKQWQFKLRVTDLTGYTERDDLTVSKGQEVVAIGDGKVWVNGELFINDIPVSGGGNAEVKVNVGRMIWLTKTSSQVVPASTQTQVTYDKSLYNDTEGMLSHESGGVRVGNDVSKLLVEGQYRDTGERPKYIYILKNGEITYAGTGYASTVNISAVISVAEGDLITVACYNTTSFTASGTGNGAWDFMRATILADDETTTVTSVNTSDVEFAMDALPVGAMSPYGNVVPPDNWLLCDGSAVSRTEYSELFAIIGTSYGVGDGVTTFNLPNKKGRNSVGLDTSDADFNEIGKTGGEKTHTLTYNEMPQHQHGVVNSNSGGYSHADYTNFGTTASSNVGYSSNIKTTKEGGNQAHNNIQPYEVDAWIIKAKRSVGIVGTNILDILTSTSITDALSANQGKVLNDKIEAISSVMTAYLGSSYSYTTTGSNTVTTMPLSGKISVGNKFTLSNNEIIVGDNVSVVKVNANISTAWNGTAQGDLLLYLYKNDNLVGRVSGNKYDANMSQGLSLSSMLLNVASGDKLKLGLYTNNAGTVNVLGGPAPLVTYVTVESVS